MKNKYSMICKYHVHYTIIMMFIIFLTQTQNRKKNIIKDTIYHMYLYSYTLQDNIGIT